MAFNLMDVKVIKLGTSLALSLPSGSSFKQGDAFLLVPDRSGSYSLVPKTNNPYAEAKSLSLYQPEQWADIEHNFR